MRATHKLIDGSGLLILSRASVAFFTAENDANLEIQDLAWYIGFTQQSRRYTKLRATLGFLVIKTCRKLHSPGARLERVNRHRRFHMRERQLTASSAPPTMSQPHILHSALNESITSGRFIDTKFYVFSCRSKSGRVGTPKALFANSRVPATVPYFETRKLP